MLGQNCLKANNQPTNQPTKHLPSSSDRPDRTTTDMSLVAHIAQALIQAADAEGVDAMTYLLQEIKQSTDVSRKSIWDEAREREESGQFWHCPTCLVENVTASEKCVACDPDSKTAMAFAPRTKGKRRYNREVPEGDKSKMSLGTVAQDSKGRWHMLVEVKAFADKTRRTWKLQKEGSGADVEVPAVAPDAEQEQSHGLVDYPLTDDEDDDSPSESDGSTGSTKSRKEYTSMKPDASAKSLEPGIIEDGKDGELWIVKAISGKRGTRHQWCRYRGTDDEQVAKTDLKDSHSTLLPTATAGPDEYTLARMAELLRKVGFGGDANSIDHQTLNEMGFTFAPTKASA